MAAARPLPITRKVRPTVIAYVVSTRPSRRANPKPRSWRRGKSVHAIGSAAAPTRSIARYQTTAAQSECAGASVGSTEGARSTSGRWSGRTGALTRRSVRGQRSQSFMVGGVFGIAPSSRRRACDAENFAVFRKSSTRGWS